MAIQATDIKFYYSGVGSPADSLGGAISGTEVTGGIHNLFDVVGSTEAQDGDTEYRCIYVKNDYAASPALTLQTAVLWLSRTNPSSDSTITVGLGGAVDAVAEDMGSNEGSPGPTTPAVSFTNPTSGSPLPIGDIPAGSFQSIWIKRQISGSATAFNTDNVTVHVRGDTAA